MTEGANPRPSIGRFQASLIHLGISLAIFAVLAYLVIALWYPDFYFAADGGWHGMRIIVFVDLILGPTLTLVIFNSAKPRGELRRDLSIVGVFQLVCLAAGTYVVFQSRPIALVYLDGSFYSMTAGAYREMDIDVPELGRYPGAWPKRVMVELPADPSLQSQIRRRALKSRVPLRAMTEYYAPLRYDAMRVEEEGLSADTLRKLLIDPKPLESWLASHDSPHEPHEQLRFFKFGTRYGFGWVALRIGSPELVGMFMPANGSAAPG